MRIWSSARNCRTIPKSRWRSMAFPLARCKSRRQDRIDRRPRRPASTHRAECLGCADRAPHPGSPRGCSRRTASPTPRRANWLLDEGSGDADHRDALRRDQIRFLVAGRVVHFIGIVAFVDRHPRDQRRAQARDLDFSGRKTKTWANGLKDDAQLLWLDHGACQ